MMPWGHLAVGYLVYTLSTRLWRRRPPRGGPTLALALGTQFPDLVDKPAGYWFGVFDGRAMGHSLLTTIPLCLAVYVAARRRDRGAAAVAFAVGTVTHLVGDAWLALRVGAVPQVAPYLLWPLLPAPTYPADSFLDHVDGWFAAVRPVRVHSLAGALDGLSVLSVLVAVAVLGLWTLDGFPGLGAGWRLLARARDRITGRV